MAESVDEGVSGRRFEVPIGELSTLTIDRYPGHVELVALNMVFVPGTRAAGYPPLDLARIAQYADAVAEIYVTEMALARTLVQAADEMEKLPGVGPLSRDVDAVRRSMSPPIMELIAGRATLASQRRARRRPRDVDFFRELVAYRSEHGVAATAAKYQVDTRQIQRWLKTARERHELTYSGMRS